MIKLKLLLSVLTFAILTLASALNSVNAQESEAQFVEGIDYFRVQSQQSDIQVDLTELQAVADLEIFYWYGCFSCWQVESALTEYLTDKSSLRVIRTPLVSHVSWREQAYIQPLMEQLADKMTLPTELDIYQACLEDCSKFSSYESGRDWLLSQVQAEDIPLIDETAIWTAEKNYRKRADSFSISQVPTIIIKESFVVSADSAKSVDRMIKIVDYLLTR